MIYRTLKIYGRSISACGNVFVDDHLVHTGSFDQPLLFKFSTEVVKNGYLDTNIALSYGRLLIEHIEVTYPAVINNNTYGYFTLTQPIAQPLVNPQSKEFLSFPISVEDKLHYKHLMFNGPTFWKLEVDNNLPLYHGINIHEKFVNYKKAIWEYNQIPFDPESLGDIKNLITW